MKTVPEWEKEPVCGAEFEKELQLYVFDLISLSLCKFNKKHPNTISESSAFGCNCVKESWLLIQLLTEKLSISKNISFWNIFNKSLKSIQQEKSI